MSVSGFHCLFKVVTAMSPLQFQKQLRLQEARRLLLNETSTPQVLASGWATMTPHFSREYKRLFGEPTMRHVGRLRETAKA